jgi:AcrR family transcriptional regulator
VVRRLTRERREHHPTKAALLDTAIRLLEHTPVEQLTVDEVVKASGISYGSLYHHYEDFPDLVEQALLALFGRHVDESIEAIRQSYDSATTQAEFAGNLRAVTRATHTPERADRRMRRIVIFANTESSPRMRDALGLEQQRLTSALAAFAREAQERGWIERSLDPEALAGFIQAYTLGRVVDDINPTPAAADGWYRVIDRVIMRAVLADPQADG